MLEEARERARVRRLGSDARAGRRIRDQVRRTQLAYLQRNWRFFSTGAVVGCVAIALVAIVAPNDFLRGAIVGGGITFIAGGLVFTVVQFTGTGSQAMGATGEIWTSSELRSLRKHGWKLVDHIFYRYRDIDHLLVGPGGVIVVESKWSADAWELNETDARLSRAFEQVQRNARDLRLAVPHLRQRDHSVHPVLFLWGGGRSGDAQPAHPVRVGSVDVVYGHDAAQAWRAEVRSASPLFDEGEISEIWSRVRAQAAQTDKQDRSEPALPTLTRVYWTACATLIAALSAMLGVMSAVRLADSTWGGYAFSTAAVSTGVAARRSKWLRYPSLGWLTGAGFITTVLIALQMFR